MSLLDYVLEARRNATSVNVSGEVPENTDDNDPSANVPEDGEVTPENNPNEEGNQEDDDAEDYTENVPEDEDDAPAEPGTATNYSRGEDADTGGEDYSQNVPEDDGPAPTPAPAENNPPAQTTPPAQEEPPAAPAEPADTGAANAGGEGGQTGGGLNIDATNQANQGAGNEDQGEDFTQGVPGEGGDEEGNDAGGTDQGNPPAPGGNENQDDEGNEEGNEDENNDENGEGDEEEGEGDDDGMDNAESFSDASDNGEDTQGMTDNDKKNNIIILRNAYVSLYSEIVGFIQKLDNVRKDSILAISTYSQVKDNMIRLRDLVVNYISLYYDSNEYEINLFNYEYMQEIIKVNLEMIRKMRKGRDKLNSVR